MIKVIKKGPDKQITRQVVCESCGATLEFVPADIKSRTFKDWDGSPETIRYIECPECNWSIPIKNP